MKRSANGQVKREGDEALDQHVIVKFTKADMERVYKIARANERTLGGQLRYVVKQWLEAEGDAR